VSTAHPADSRIYGHLWTTPEVSALFTDEGRTQAWLDILAALAQAQADVGLVPRAAADAISAHADASRLDLALVAEQTRATGHSTLGLIRALREVLPADAREWVYYGATVQDLSDTWFALVFRALGAIAERDVGRMRDRALGLAAEHRGTPMCGRTHGQPGLPITFGFKAAVWAAELDRHLARLRQGRSRWELAQLGGALGTMEFWGDRALDLLDAFAGRLGLRAPDAPWLTARDGVAEFIWLLAAISATTGKIGNEVYQLQRPEIGELSETFTPGTVGSITMPHKRNPEISEHLVTLSRAVRAQAGLALGRRAGDEAVSVLPAREGPPELHVHEAIRRIELADHYAPAHGPSEQSNAEVEHGARREPCGRLGEPSQVRPRGLNERQIPRLGEELEHLRPRARQPEPPLEDIVSHAAATGGASAPRSPSVPRAVRRPPESPRRVRRARSRAALLTAPRALRGGVRHTARRLSPPRPEIEATGLERRVGEPEEARRRHDGAALPERAKSLRVPGVANGVMVHDHAASRRVDDA
jgi:hypothetical protein